ncbi:MAG: hypothetical protein OEM50_08935 [Gammaproteobacteria bacterium]|nr:hypothetical protein [Gammaproteobacteria bacterium]MDH3481827.1 hypothetical protein [Gammaproteobacteria bacterium]
MATRFCCMLGLSLVILSCMLFEPASAELRPVKAWQCTAAAAETRSGTEGVPDREIILFEYRSPDNCLNDAQPPIGANVCRADYTKDGVTETLWRARNNRDYCRPRAENLVQGLDATGFYCVLIKIEECEGQAEIAADSAPVESSQPARQAAPVSETEPARKTEAKTTIEPAAGSGALNTATTTAAQSPAPIDKTANREKQLIDFFNGLFDGSLARAMADAAIPDDFSVYDQNTLSSGNGETLRFTQGTHAWETRRDRGVLVINADFQRGTSFNDVFFGFAFDRSDSKNEPDRHQIRYLGVVSAETSSEVIYAGEDKIIISSKWYTESGDCYSSQTTDEYQWSDSIYGTLQMRTISEENNPDCANGSSTPSP